MSTGTGAQAPSVLASWSNKVNVVAPRAPRSWQISERGTVIVSLRSSRRSAAKEPEDDRDWEVAHLTPFLDGLIALLPPTANEDDRLL